MTKRKRITSVRCGNCYKWLHWEDEIGYKPSVGIKSPLCVKCKYSGKINLDLIKKYEEDN